MYSGRHKEPSRILRRTLRVVGQLGLAIGLLILSFALSGAVLVFLIWVALKTIP